MRLVFSLPAVLLFSIFASSGGRAQAPSPAPAPTLTLIGEGGTSKVLTMADLAALPQFEVSHPETEGPPTTLKGPSVRSLMTLVGAPTGTMLRGPAMVLVVMAEADDGLKVAYTLTELDEQFGNRLAVVGLTQNGAPIPAEDGPLRIAVAGDQYRARWTRHVARLRLVRVGG